LIRRTVLGQVVKAERLVNTSAGNGLLGNPPTNGVVRDSPGGSS